MAEPLATWNDGTARQAIVDFVERVTKEGGPDYVAPSERIAVYDNDGTLWCEKPMPIELGFVLIRLAEMAEQDESLRNRQPWQAAHEKDFAWLGEAITKHYHGDSSDVKGADGRHPPSLRRPERRGLLDRRRHVPPWGKASHPRPRLPRMRLPADDRAAALPRGQRVHQLHRLRRRPRLHATRHGRDLPHPRRAGDRQLQRARLRRRRARRHRVLPGVDGRLRRRPGQARADLEPHRETPDSLRRNSNGDIPMLRYTGGRDRPALRLLVLHDDDEREFAYTAGAEASLERAADEAWTVISIKNDWAAVFVD